MAYYKVTFGHWYNDGDPATDDWPAEELLSQRHHYYVEAASISEARKIAERYTGIETHAFEGIGGIVDITLISHGEVTQFENVSSLDAYRRY